jgi:hypothetical protein
VSIEGTDVTKNGHRERAIYRRRNRDKINIGPTKDPEKRLLPEHETLEHAERFSGLYPEEIEHETRNVRLDFSFTDPIKIRDQVEAAISALQEVFAITRNHRLTSLDQRRQARHTTAVLGRTLSLMNGKTPYGYKRKG